ncbi:MAG: DUF1501 domain-containing protein [Planctomycetota bacterium]|jgi:hypothetical protein|nr:DUF1501 domain-containing protein [Planctomycetota bacterium]MDA0918549.1 DUF1501 domain-containing protein [Planctomycetota bacterium]MDA1160468.1 DUF1501 domain-containing protein [Planctomycetota bacterium]
MHLPTPNGMSRRHFMSHMAGAAATIPAMNFIEHIKANAATARKNNKACILLWCSGGPPTIDIWDLKPGSKNGGEFKPIDTAAPGVQITEHMPKTAKVFDKLSIVRSMSTREADHGRGRYFMHTGFVPNPTVVHPTFGSVVAHEAGSKRQDLEIPGFISINAPSGSPGYMGTTNAPFVVDGNGRISNADVGSLGRDRLGQRLSMLGVIEDNFIKSKRGDLPQDHKNIYKKAVNLMTSEQMKAFDVTSEPQEILDLYTGGPPAGNGGMMMRNAGGFGRSLLMARRLVEVGVPFIEVGVNVGGWDLHNDVFNTLKNNNLPQMDTAISGLVTDLTQRGMIDDVSIVWMGEFARTPRINQNVGRDHWAASWSVMMGGGGLNNGQAIGETNADGTACVSKSYLPGDIWATVAHAMGIPTSTVHTSKNGRPMKIANGGTPIQELIS